MAVDSPKDVDSLDHVQAESSVVGRLSYNTSGGRQDSSREYEELSQLTTEKQAGSDLSIRPMRARNLLGKTH